MSELERLVLFAEHSASHISLRELLESFGVVRGIEPATVHDALNKLLSSGRLLLGLDGRYSKPL